MFDLKGFDRRIELVLWPLNGRQLKFSSELPAEKSQSDAVKKAKYRAKYNWEYS
jgi:hypothetical protein